MKADAKIKTLDLVIKYLEMVKFSEFLIMKHTEDMRRFPEFLNMKSHYENRIKINKDMIEKMNIRIFDLTNKTL